MLVAGKGAQAARRCRRRSFAGVNKVLLAESDALAERLAEPLADTILKLADGYDAIVAPATTMGKNVMPRVAALLDVMQISEVVEIVSADTFKRPIYAGNAIQTVQSSDAKKIITVRTSSFQAAGRGRLGECRERGCGRRWGPFQLRPENRIAHSERPELTLPRSSSRAGARSAQGKVFWGKRFDFAADSPTSWVRRLEASRAAVDSGLCADDGRSASRQVLAPDLYSRIRSAFPAPSRSG